MSDINSKLKSQHWWFCHSCCFLLSFCYYRTTAPIMLWVMQAGIWCVFVFHSLDHLWQQNLSPDTRNLQEHLFNMMSNMMFMIYIVEFSPYCIHDCCFHRGEGFILYPHLNPHRVSWTTRRWVKVTWSCSELWGNLRSLGHNTVSSCPRGRTEEASAPLSLSWRQKLAALSWPDVESGRVTFYRSLRGVHWCVDVHVASPVSNHIHRILDRTGSRTRFVALVVSVSAGREHKGNSDASFHGSDQLQNQSEPLLIRSSGIVHEPISSHPPSS